LIEKRDVAGRSLRAALTDVLEHGFDLTRLGYAQTSVRFELVEDDDAVTLLLDREPPVIAAAEEPAEIVVELAGEQAEAMASGRLSLPAAVVAGEVRTRGPVRRFLEVEPILRHLLAQTAGSTEPAPDVQRQRLSPSASAGLIDADLLAIETRGLEKSFGSADILKGVDLTVPEGVISAVIGPSGTGKSVLLQHILGLLKADSGDVIIRGRSLSKMSHSEMLALRTEIGVMFQDGALFSAMNVYDNVAFPLRQHTDLGEREVREAVEARLAAVGLSDAAQAMPAALSGGMKKRAGLARALVLEPTIVLCDEPDSGLDPVRTALLGELLVEQHAETGGTMLVITHNIALATRVAEHITVLWQGRVLESGMSSEILASENPFVRQFLAGESQGPLGMDA
jgi:phospholipid/cholesterol/gamma-HCH transport system ATP-binding protein